MWISVKFHINPSVSLYIVLPFKTHVSIQGTCPPLFPLAFIQFSIRDTDAGENLFKFIYNLYKHRFSNKNNVQPRCMIGKARLFEPILKVKTRNQYGSSNNWLLYKQGEERDKSPSGCLAAQRYGHILGWSLYMCFLPTFMPKIELLRQLMRLVGGGGSRLH